MTRLRVLVWQGGWKGGAENRQHAIARALARRGHDVSIAVYERNEDSELDQVVFPRRLPKRLEGYNQLIAQHRIARYLEREHYDIAYSRLPSTPSDTFNVTFECGDLDDWLRNQPNIASYLAYAPLLRTIKRFAKRADLNLSGASWSTAFFERHGIGNIAETSNFVDTRVFAREAHRLLPETPRTILFVGRRAHQKNWTAVLDAARRLPELSFRLAGIEGASAGNVEYLGWMDQTRLAREYNRADLLLMPSRFEGYPLTMLEALACGTPVVISRAALISEFEAYVTPCGLTAASIVSALKDASEHYAEIRNKTERGYHHVTRELDERVVLERECETIEDAYARWKRAARRADEPGRDGSQPV